VDILYPKIKLKQLPLILVLALLGALMAGIYGIIHDQITYSISEEYFTKFKFYQFSYTDFGYSPRIRVIEIGFLATWWVGLIAGWFLARYAIQHFSAKLTIKYVLQGFAMILICAFLFGLFGFLFGFYWLHGKHLDSWHDWEADWGVIDLRSFAIVGYVHNSGYLGALVGLIGGMIYLRRLRNSPKTPI
jgi:hypothetical protein